MNFGVISSKMAYNFSVVQGSEVSVRLAITTGDASLPQNLSGYLVRGKVKRRYGDTNYVVDLDPTIVSGDEGEAYQSGYIDIYLSGSQTDSLPIIDGRYDVERYTTGSDAKELSVFKLLQGRFTVNPEVTS
jgi:hypothetical protein